MDNMKERIKKAFPLEEFFQREGINLIPTGDGKFKAICPFHDDKNPSLSIDTGKQLWHCFGCNEGGDIFNYVMKKLGLDFKEALQYLSNVLNIKNEVMNSSVDLSTRVQILNRLTEIYHKNLLESKEAIEYLKARGIGTPEIINTFKLGYSKGAPHSKLLELLSKERCTTLEKLGVITKVKDRYYETFKDCVIFPIINEEGHTLEIYARAVNDTARVKHHYLKGKHEGVFNSKALRVFDEIIITESIIDALSCYALGFKNVTASFGVLGFTDNHLEMMEECNIRRIIIAYDNDEAGKKASLKLKEKLKQAGFINVRILSLPEGIKDINEYLTKGGTTEEFKKLLYPEEEIPVGKVTKEEMKELVLNVVNGEGDKEQSHKCNTIEGQDRQITQLPNGDYEFTSDDGVHSFNYRIRGIREDFNSPSLNVGIRVSYEENNTNYFYDSVNLYSARARLTFAKTIAFRFEVSHETILTHLETILDEIEKMREKQILSKAGVKDIEISNEEKELGLKLLNNPNVLEEIREDISTLGYIGEEMNKLLVYIIATSRKMEEPLAGIIISRSSAGKSKLTETVKKLIPDDEVISISSASDTALYYATDLSHKFVCMGESKGNENIEYPLRELISSKEITRMVTMKDEKTGQLKGMEIKTKGPIAYIETSTGMDDINPENLNRCLILFVDETQQQTRRILEYQRFLQTPQGFLVKQRIPSIIQKHKIAQKLLKPTLVINPYAELMGFPERRLEARRDQMKFIQVLNAVAFLNQYKREKKVIEDEETPSDKTVAHSVVHHVARHYEYIEPTLEDYKATYELLVKSGILSNTLSDIPKNARDLYEIIKDMVIKISKESKKSVKDILFTRKMVWEYSGWSNFQLWKYLNILLDYELIEIVNGGINGKKNTYRVYLEEEIEKLMLEAIPTPNEMEERTKKIKNH